MGSTVLPAPVLSALSSHKAPALLIPSTAEFVEGAVLFSLGYLWRLLLFRNCRLLSFSKLLFL